jgi:hypothetical protein
MSSAAAAPPYAREPPPTKSPSVSGWRVAGGVLIAGVSFALIGWLPAYAESYAARLGFPSPVAPSLLLVAGGLLAALAGASFALKPTTAWGPCRAVLSAVSIGYLLFLIRSPVYTFSIAPVSLSLTYGRLLWLLLIVPALGLASALVTTIEDWRRPGERARLTFA